MSERRGGIIQIQANGVLYDAKGAFTYNLGRPKREAIVGADSIHDYKETPKVPFIEGEVTDRSALDVSALQDQTDVTVTLSLANGKVIVLRDAWFAADGDVSTEEGNIQVRWEGKSAREIRA